MNKQIDELEKEYVNMSIERSKQFRCGFQEAQRIVGSHDPWIPVNEFPIRVTCERNHRFSYSVLLKDEEEGSYSIGIYDYQNEEWDVCSGITPTHYMTIP